MELQVRFSCDTCNTFFKGIAKLHEHALSPMGTKCTQGGGFREEKRCVTCGYGQYLVDKKKKPSAFCNADGKKCRSGGIRTRGLLVPNQTRYQTALHLEKRANRGTRTLDLRFTKPLLYRLSHVGTAETIQLY
jgi:hypothetical protein